MTSLRIAFGRGVCGSLDEAVKLARDNGYGNLTRTVVPAWGHVRFANEVVDFFATLLANK